MLPIVFVLLAFVQIFTQRCNGAAWLNYYSPQLPSQTAYQMEAIGVPGYDPNTTFWATIQFDAGYMGMQVINKTSRCIIFSIWDDPTQGQSAKLISKGPQTTTKTFGGEGTGVNTQWHYNWISGEPQTFLITAKLNLDKSTIFSAYHSVKGKVTFIASIQRTNYDKLIMPYGSFVEDWSSTHKQARKGLFGCHFAMDARKSTSWVEQKQSLTAYNPDQPQYGVFYTVEGAYFGIEADGFTRKAYKEGAVLTRATCPHPPMPLPQY